jgi:phospholipid/cholesterol/gamma-HCH transport system permease protein
VTRESRYNNITGSTGRWFLSKFGRISDQLAFFYVCLKMMIRHRTTGKQLLGRVIVQQIYFTGVQSFELVILVATITGAVMVLGGLSQLAKLGSMDELAILLIVVLIRELGPILSAMIILLRSGSAIALEIGYMNVLGEIEGLQMQGIPVMHFLCVPRLIGVSTAVLCIVILFDIIAITGGFFAAWIIQDINFWSFLYTLSTTLTRSDFALVVVKGLIFGIMIPVVCLYHGFQARDAITNVPPRVSRALVDCLLYTVFLNILISVAFLF